MIEKSVRDSRLSAPVSGFGPGDFPLGSPESRAAARMRLRQQQDSRSWLTFEDHDEFEIGEKPCQIAFDAWKELPDGDYMRVVHVPMTFRMLPAGESSVPADRIPACPDCGTLFVETNRCGPVAQFLPGCVNRHDPMPAPTCPRREGFILGDADRQAAKAIIAKLWDVEDRMPQ